jgi:hypothetical protein
MTTITARVYDTDGSQDWVGLPTPREAESLSDYAYRLQKWARREILDASDSYGDCDHVRSVDEPHEGHVVVRAETDEEYVEYYLACTVKQWEPSAKDRALFSRQLAREGDAFARAQWEREL